MRILVLVAFLVAGCTEVPESTSRATTGLTFVHLNDTYRISAVEDGTKGGIGRVVTVVRDLQEQGRDVRILHAGDFLYPSLESQLWHGQQMVEALNYLDDLAPLYLTIGNHETDRREPVHLVNAIHVSRFDWLGDNYRLLTGDADADAALQSAFTYEHGDKTVGIFSLTLHATDGGNDRDYLAVDRDYIGVARRVIERFDAQGVDVIIGLTHLHMWMDEEIAQLKTEYPKFAFIVGGHEHELQYGNATPNSVPVMKGASNARVIWRITVTFDAAGLPIVSGRRLEMDESVAADAGFATVDQKWRRNLLSVYPFLETGVGRAAFPLDATEQTIRNRETSWGNFIVDQMRGAFGEPEAELAFLNSGSLRIDDFVVDDIRFEDIERTFGFSAALRFLTISGAEFRQLMEAGYRGEGTDQGYFPQVSGFRICIDRRRDAYDRIVSLQVPTGPGWQEIDADRDYTLIVSDFIYRGGDGYVIPESSKTNASRPGSDLKYLVLDAVVRAQADARAIGEPVDPANPRHVELGEERLSCWEAG